jgi:cell division topological specificity factor
MGLLDYFRASRNKKGSATVARERLQILVAHDRAERDRPSYLPKLQEELIAVISKYVKIDRNKVSVSLERGERQDILELNIVLSDDTVPSR